MLAQWISITRSRGAARESYEHFKGVSPLLANTQAQADQLEKAMQEDYPNARVFVSMRYWHPMADEAARQVKDFAPDKIILLPLYPQFSTTTTFSSFGDWRRAAKAAGIDAPIHCV